MNENTPEWPEWLVKAAQETVAMLRQATPLTQAAQRYVEDLRAAQAGVGPWPLPGHDLALAMDAGMRTSGGHPPAAERFCPWTYSHSRSQRPPRIGCRQAGCRRGQG